jgi:hypothetical protein
MVRPGGMQFTVMGWVLQQEVPARSCNAAQPTREPFHLLVRTEGNLSCAQGTWELAVIASQA